MFYGRKRGVRLGGKRKAVQAKAKHRPALDPTSARDLAPPCDPILPQLHVGSTTSLTPSKFVPIAVAEEDYSDNDDDGEVQRQVVK